LKSIKILELTETIACFESFLDRMERAFADRRSKSQDFVLLAPISDNYPPMRNGHMVNMSHIWLSRVCVCYSFNLTKMIVSVCNF